MTKSFDLLAAPCELFTKQLATAALPEVIQAFVHSCFGGYFESERRNPTRVRTPKRYSGDINFEAGRYYTISQDSTGDDGGTLQNELYAYGCWGERPPGYFQYWDLSTSNYRELALQQLKGKDRDMVLRAAEKPCLLLGLCSIRDQLHPIVRALDRTDEVLYVGIPLSIKRLRLDRVVDLRVPSIAQEFACIASRLPGFVNGTPVEELWPLLPTMLTQELGGGYGFSLVVGAAMRDNGVEGLIYPSARNDVFLRTSPAHLEWGGWNLVDYRGAPRSSNTLHVDIDSWYPEVRRWSYAPDGLRRVFSDVQISYEVNGTNRGSWAVAGLRAWQEAMFELTFLGQFAHAVDPSLAEPVQDFVDFMLRQASDGSFALSFAVTLQQAAEGHREAQSALMPFVARLRSEAQPQHAETLERFLRACRSR
jgi:hypothetical protein